MKSTRFVLPGWIDQLNGRDDFIIHVLEMRRAHFLRRLAAKSLSVEAVLKLTGDAAQRCVLCHKVGNQGVDHGPSLVGRCLARSPNVIAESLIEPSKTIAHGFDGVEVKTRDGITIHGIKGATGKVVSYRRNAPEVSGALFSKGRNSPGAQSRVAGRI